MKCPTSQAIRVGLFFVFGLILIWIVYETLTEATFYKSEGYEIDAPFSDLKQLKVSDDVRMAGVRIGSVVNTELKGDRAIAILNIEKGYQIPRDSVARISTAGLLGANYVNIEPGSQEQYLQTKEVISTVEAADISTVINQIGTISQRIDTFIADIEGALKYSEDNQGTIAMLLYDKEVAKDVKTTANNMASFTTKLNSKDSTIGRLVSDDELYRKANDAVNKIQNAVSTVEDSGPITSVGVVAGALF